jgi:hypothetical protein
LQKQCRQPKPEEIDKEGNWEIYIMAESYIRRKVL